MDYENIEAIRVGENVYFIRKGMCVHALREVVNEKINFGVKKESLVLMQLSDIVINTKDRHVVKCRACDQETAEFFMNFAPTFLDKATDQAEN